jgi:1,5-anhydro-D-fructose reductase (1,5-anhydro-D-mannitol-forming)
MKSITGTVQWGIIGCGDVCEIKSGPAFNKIQNSKLVAVMRRDASKAKDYAMRHGVGKFYDDASALINDPEVNAIYIATPPVFHEPYTIESMKAGKPVYIEKPVSVSSASCERMIQAQHQYHCKATVAHYRRGLPIFKKVKSLVKEGAIGNVRLVRLTTLQPPVSKIITQTEDHWRVKPELSGGGIFHDLSPHQLDILLWIFGAPVAVNGNSLNQSGQYNAPDIATLEAVYEGNVCLQGVWAFNVNESGTEDKCEIFGDRGVLTFSFFRKSNIELKTNSGTEILEFAYPENIQHPMIDAVVKFFRGEGPNPCMLEEALQSMQMMDTTLSA